MELTFSTMLTKKWTLLDDKIIYGDDEILLSDIQSLKLACKSRVTTNGVIQIKVNNKFINLAYPNKLKKEGEIAFKYLQDNNNYQPTTKLGEIINEINNLPVKDNWGTRKEIAELPNILADDERIKAITSGLTEGNTWLIVCTNKRVLMLDKGLIYGLKVVDIPLDRINSISHSKGLLLGKISITDGALTRTIDNVSNTTVSFFADTVNKEVELFKSAKISPTMQVIHNASPTDELIKCKQLLDMGVLTQEEFDEKKKELLARI